MGIQLELNIIWGLKPFEPERPEYRPQQEAF